MKQILLFSLLVVSSSVLFGQTKKFKSVDLSEVRKNKTHIELGLRSFSSIWNGTATGTLLIKRTFTGGDLVEVNSMNLVRSYFTINSQVNLTDDPSRITGDTSIIVYHPSNNINFTVGLGIERQKRGKQFVHYYGLDLFAQFYKTDDDVSNGSFGGITVNQVGTTDRLVETLKSGINPFIGAKFYFTDQLSLGIESGLQLFYFSTKFTELERENKLINGQFEEVLVEKDPVKSKGFGALFNGVRFITVGYAF